MHLVILLKVYGLLLVQMAKISGTKYVGNTASGSPLSGLVSESSIVLQYGGSTSHGSR